MNLCRIFYLFLILVQLSSANASATRRHLVNISLGPLSKFFKTDLESKGTPNNQHRMIPSENITWTHPDPPEIQIEEESDGTYQLFTLLDWVSKDENDQFLVFGFKKADQIDSFRHQVKAPLSSERELVELVRVLPDGDLQADTIELFAPTFWELKNELEFERNRKFWLMPYVGLTYLEVDQPGFTSLIELEAQAQLQLVYYFHSSSWSVGAKVDLDIPILSSNINAIYAWRLGSSITLQKTHLFSHGRFDMGFGLGGYYSTMFVSNNYMGHQNVYGPDFFPILNYRLWDSFKLTLIPKYLPIMNQLGFLSLSSRFIEIQLELQRTLPKGRQWVCQFSFKDIYGFLQASTPNYPTHLQTFSLDFGFHWW
jgi:hypothetical protein